jgi:hypothetical protein
VAKLKGSRDELFQRVLDAEAAAREEVRRRRQLPAAGVAALPRRRARRCCGLAALARRLGLRRCQRRDRLPPAGHAGPRRRRGAGSSRWRSCRRARRRRPARRARRRARRSSVRRGCCARGARRRRRTPTGRRPRCGSCAPRTTCCSLSTRRRSSATRCRCGRGGEGNCSLCVSCSLWLTAVDGTALLAWLSEAWCCGAPRMQVAQLQGELRVWEVEGARLQGQADERAAALREAQQQVALLQVGQRSCTAPCPPGLAVCSQPGPRMPGRPDHAAAAPRMPPAASCCRKAAPSAAPPALPDLPTPSTPALPCPDNRRRRCEC